MAAAVDVNLSQLSSFTSLPESTFSNLLSNPTSELVKTLLTQISSKAQEYETVKSENVKLGVEVENAVRTGDTKSRLLKGSVEKGLKEATDLRQKLQAEEVAKISLETELRSIKASSSSCTAEVLSLQQRITELESSNRDKLTLLESKSKAFDDLASELSEKHKKTLDLRRDISTHEQTIRSINATASSAKYREQSLQQEIDSLRRNNEWLDQELKTKTAEFSKFRKEKSSYIAELQRQNNDASTAIDTANRTEQTLRTRLEEVNQKADEFLSQTQQLREEAARQEESFRTELDSSHRLAELLQNSVDTERLRQQELQSQLDETKENAAEQLGKVNAEIETEHQDRLAAESRIAELEVQIERLEADAMLESQHVAVPRTPRPMVNGDIRGTPTPDRSPSRTFSPAPSLLRGGLNFTQLFSEYNGVKAQLEAEKRRNVHLSSTIDEMLQGLDAKKPELDELQADRDRFQSEVVEMSLSLDSVCKERDQAKKDARRWEGQVAGLGREGDVLRQQLRDLSSQVKVLLMEVNASNEGLSGYSPEERLRLEQLARGELDEESSSDGTDTDRFISQNLVIYRKISDLQDQNTKLLRLTRELGTQMEGEEALRQKDQATQMVEQIEALRQHNERLADEAKTLSTQSQSYIQERDMFRRMLSHRGQFPPESELGSMFGESVGGRPVTPSRHNLQDSIERSPTSKELADHVKALKEMQIHFDSYRQEAASDRSTLKDQVDSLSRKSAELRAEVSRRNGEVTLAHERYEMLQSNYSMLKNENTELQKRSHTLSDRAAQQDMRVQQVAEDLVEAKGVIESLRNETANLKAEKEFWRTIEKRLTDDNANLLNERERLSTLNINLQTMQNEHEHLDKASRRRLESQIEALEGELNGLKRKLADEAENNRNLNQRREYEQQQSQKRIDDLISSLSSVREELASMRTTRDHLQTRLDEMTMEVRNAESRLHVLQFQGATSSNAALPESTGSTLINSNQSSVEREYELVTELTDLKRQLEHARSDLDNVKVQVEQYKAISQSSEEELQSLNDTQDQYRQEMDSIIAERDAKIQEMQQRFELVQSELTKLEAEFSTLQAEKVDSDQRLEEQKDVFEAEVNRIKDWAERNESAARFHQEDLKVQAEIAQQAQQNYENELVKHADAARNLQKVRAEFSQLKLEAIELKTEAESARTSLSQSEESWVEAKEHYEQEILDLKTRREDTHTQNQLLHKQLENVNGQITALQHKQSMNPNTEEDTPNLQTSGHDNLQELISYLRREKEIVDVQLELSSQESKRLRQQFGYTQSQLDETRLKLNQQRRAEENSERNALNHNKLMETINELNLNRESNVTLRLEKNQAQSSLVEKSKLAEELKEQIQLLDTKVRELEDMAESQQEDLRMAQEARERFEQRYHDILNRSDAVDPAEFESLKEQLTALQIERDTLSSAKDALQGQVDEIPDQIQKLQEKADERLEESRNKLKEQAKAKSREQTTKINEKDAALRSALQTASEEKDSFQKQIATLQEDLDVARAARDQAQTMQEAAQDETAKVRSQTGVEDGQITGDDTENPNQAEMLQLREEIQMARARADEVKGRLTQLQHDFESSQTRVLFLESQLTTMQQNLDIANSRASDLQSQIATQQAQTSLQPITSQNVELEEQLENLRRDLSQAQQDADALRSSASVTASVANLQGQEGSTSISEQITEQVEAIRTELTTRHDQRIQQEEVQFKKRADNMRAQLSTKLKEGKEIVRNAMMVEHMQALEDLKSRHQEDIDALETRHQNELDELKRNEKSRIVEPKQDAAEQSHTVANGTEAIKDEPHMTVLDDHVAWTEAQVKHLIATNETVKSIVKRNIVHAITKEKDSWIAAQKDEQQKVLSDALADADTKAKEAKEQAVLMEGKKYVAKMSMAENRARTAQTKLDYVDKASNETPQKPVIEVWQIAKTVKPVSVASRQPQQSQPQALQTLVQNQGQSQSTMFGKPTPDGPTQTPVTQGMFGKPTPSQGQIRQPSAPQVDSISKTVDSPRQENSSSMLALTKSSQQNNTDGENQHQPTRLPDKPLQSQGTQRPNVGTGVAALKNLQSGLPVPNGGRGTNQINSYAPHGSSQGSQQNRGGMNNLGRGRGYNRSGSLNISSQSTQQAQSSPTSGAPLSATARQFVPGSNKRHREDGQDVEGDASNGKRIRGGGQGN